MCVKTMVSAHCTQEFELGSNSVRTRFELGPNSVGSEMCVETIGFGVFYLRVRTRFELGFELRLGEMPMKTNTFASSAGRTPFSN